MKYKISTYYETGDSLNTYQEEECLDMSWGNLEVAKENLMAIKEHYEMYKQYEKTTTNKKRQFLDKFVDKWWFIDDDGTGDGMFNYMRMKLKADNGNLMEQRNPWCGVFERLISAEIVFDNTDLRIEF